jgi:predicted kinase
VEAILLIGIQGAGKSTFCRESFYDTHVRISLDLLRTRYRERRLLELCLETRMPFVVDKTNATRAERARTIEAARAAGFRVVGYYFEPDPQGASARNRARPRPVPAAGLFGTLKRLQEPVLEEGFDRLHRVRLRPEGGFAVSPPQVATTARP